MVCFLYGYTEFRFRRVFDPIQETNAILRHHSLQVVIRLAFVGHVY